MKCSPAGSNWANGYKLNFMKRCNCQQTIADTPPVNGFNGAVSEPCIVPQVPGILSMHDVPTPKPPQARSTPEYHSLAGPRANASKPVPVSCGCRPPRPPCPHPAPEPWVIDTSLKDIDVVGVGEINVRRTEDFLTRTYEIGVDLSKKADKTYVDAGLAKKADKTYVDAGLTKKADKTYVDAGLTKKADKTYVDAELAKKVNWTEMREALSLKVDKEPGKDLSTNDFTNSDKEKLSSIGNYPAEEGGSTTTLVTTGDKWSWDNKLDNTTYFLNGATVSEDGDASILTITGSDGTQTVFSVVGGHNVIESISADGTELPIIGRNVDIPLADANIPGEAGNAGLVRGTYEAF